MRIKARPIVLLLALLTAPLLARSTYAAAASTEVDSLVNGFPTLDQLETHLALATPSDGEEATPPARKHANSAMPDGAVYPVSARWFTAPQPATFFHASATASNTESREKPMALLLAQLDQAQRDAAAIGTQISRQNNLAINKYLLDRWTGYARTEYGTDITGLFVNGVSFGSLQQTLRQSYGGIYELRLLQRYNDSTKWTRLLSRWTISSSAGVMPLINPTLQLRQLLNNLSFSWSVALSYNLSGAMLRRMQDGQYSQEVDFANAAGRAVVTRDELLRTMALRMDALSAHPPVRDTRVGSLRQLYPQFELYQARYEQATSCDERMEDFFTLKGLALSLLTMAGYDRTENAGSNLLQTWKRARFQGCGRAS